MTKSNRLGAVVALGLIASATMFPQTPAIADSTPLPGIASAAQGQCATTAPRGPLGY